MKFSTERWHLAGLYYVAALEKLLSIHDDLKNNRIHSASSSLRILLELVLKGLFIVRCVQDEDLRPDRIEKLWKRQEHSAKTKKFIETNASIERLARDLAANTPHLEILHRLLSQVTPKEKTTFIKKLHHAVHGEIDGIRLWVEQGDSNASVRDELEWLSGSLLRFFKISADFDFRNNMSLDPELRTAILNKYEEIVHNSSARGIMTFFAEEVEAFTAANTKEVL